jgi:hypothetical protein
LIGTDVAVCKRVLHRGVSRHSVGPTRVEGETGDQLRDLTGSGIAVECELEVAAQFCGLAGPLSGATQVNYMQSQRMWLPDIFCMRI